MRKWRIFCRDAASSDIQMAGLCLLCSMIEGVQKLEKRAKINEWRIDKLIFDIEYRPAKSNVAAEDFSRVYFSSVNSHDLTLEDLPDGSRLLHFLRSTNLPFSTENVKNIFTSYRVFAELKDLPKVRW